MPLILHTGNRLEKLADTLMSDWQRNPVSPLTTRPLIVESGLLGRWFRQRLSRRQGIAMLVETSLPATFLWRTALERLELGSSEDLLSRDRMQWRIHHLLGDPGELLDRDCAAPLVSYLRDADDLKRWQLAGRIADVLDRYQYHRPELIRAWNTGDFSIGEWQGPLWRRLADEAPWQRVELLDRFIESLGGEASGALPPRVDLFSIHNMPRLLLEAWVALSRHCQVHLWLLSPTDQYWADLVSPRQLARQRLESPESADLWQLGHPLLTRWGRQGQVFQDLLLEATEALAVEDECHCPPQGSSLLHRLQAEIFTAEPPGPEKCILEEEPRLPSIQFHVCHGAMRECQVLRDTLLHCLEEDPTLHPEDILVMVPEIDRYAPYIEAVFGSGGSRSAPVLPYNLSDVSRSDEHPLIRAFLSLLDLPTSRFTRAEVVSLLHLPEVRRRLSLDEEDMAELVEILDTLNVYWGLDAGDKRQRLDLPAIPDNTWQQAFERIMAGYALGQEHLYGEIAPLAGTGSQRADRAARLFDLLERLREASRALARPADARSWAVCLTGLVRALFGEEEDEEGRLGRIHEALSELVMVETLHPAPLGPEVIRSWLAQRLGSENDRGRPYTGGVTFCALQPLRGVPFRVIALLGMQEEAFPRRHTAPDFDRMARHWRHGDPLPVLEDRYLFLETLLAARERLILSWTGRDPRSNDPLPPSVVVDELRDHLDRYYRLSDGRSPCQALTYEHPLQPFSGRNFMGELPGFDHWWCRTATVMNRLPAPETLHGWPEVHMPRPSSLERSIEPRALGRFLRDPARQFVQHRMRLRPVEEAILAEAEPMEEDGLARWGLLQTWLERWLEGEPEEEIEGRLHAEGRLLHGALGRRQLEQLREGLTPLQEIDLPFALPLRRVVRDCRIELARPEEEAPWYLEGRLSFYRRDTERRSLLITCSASRVLHADLLPLWVEHLCLHAAAGDEAGHVSFHLATDSLYRLRPVAREEARELLASLLDLYVQGQQSPLPFFRKSSSAWIAAEGDEEKAISAARNIWLGNNWQEGEKDQPHCRILLSGREWEPDEAFARVTGAILGPLSEYLEQVA